MGELAVMIMVMTWVMIMATEGIMVTTVQSMAEMETEAVNPEMEMAVASMAVTVTETMTVTTTATVMTAVMITMVETVVETVVEMEITNHQITNQRNQKIQRSQISQVTKHFTGDVIINLTISPPFTDCDVIFTPI